MKGSEIREKFLRFFEENGHTRVKSSSLVPQDDPTLLFTNAGMVQFKRVFMGEDKRDYVTATTSQCCVRAGGKHNDLENVGYTARHHTFFEMLGNFSFGDYFKEDAIRYAWDFLTRIIGLPKDKLWVSVFEEDDEAFALWEKIDDLPKGRIIRLGEADNFWAMGDTGPCGPCSEILIDQGPAMSCGPDCKAGCDCDRFLELWNLVFMQFYRDESGKMTPLPKPSIDTGMGLERIAAVVQGKFSNYDSDLFSGIIHRIAATTGKKYGEDPRMDTAMRVIADHARATTFLVADGVLPSNEGRGYVLRRIMRRAIRYGRALGLHTPFLAGIIATVVDEMQAGYSHISDARELLNKVVQNEEVRFLETIDHGLAMLHEEIERLSGAGEQTVAGEFIFKLYDTFGFPVDIVRDIALEKGMTVDEAGFHAAMEVQKQQSRKSWKGKSLAEKGSGIRELLDQGIKSRFVGYDTRRHHSEIITILNEKAEKIAAAQQGDKVSIVCPETPFYAESGGQIGDQGEIAGPQGKAQVHDTVKAGDGLSIHLATVIEGSFKQGDAVELKVAESRRQRIANNHTGTHLLHAALRNVLGEHVKQSGSLVEVDRLRFDFTHFSPITPQEIKKIEAIVNDEIRANTNLQTNLFDRDEAIKSGATALFGEKYDEKVRVVSVGAFSKELCGGTHVGATGEIGLLKITGETGIAAGVRRIEAVTGPEAFQKFQEIEGALIGIADELKTTLPDISVKLKKILARQKELEKEVSLLTARMVIADIDSMIQNAKIIDGVRVISEMIPLDSPKTLREVGDRIRDKMGSGIVVLGGKLNEKVALLAIVSKDLTKKFHAGNIIKEIASTVGGSGGGRPDMAQAGGTLGDKLPEALSNVFEIIKKQAN
ncbi:MAG: alanine--tRNA ligase [Proteobacteria bacterium]|nr:alanine--tRNA ligase [Pseudomonadota bacterium]